MKAAGRAYMTPNTPCPCPQSGPALRNAINSSITAIDGAPSKSTPRDTT
jgi:hypothetical protein